MMKALGLDPHVRDLAEFLDDVPPRIEMPRPRPERRRGELVVGGRSWSFSNLEASLVAVPSDPGSAIRCGDVVLDEVGDFAGIATHGFDPSTGTFEADRSGEVTISFEAPALSPMLRGVIGLDVQQAFTCQIDRMREERLNDLRAQFAETRCRFHDRPQPREEPMPASFRPIENHRCIRLRSYGLKPIRMEVEVLQRPPPQPAVPFHLQNRNPRSARQAHRMGARS